MSIASSPSPCGAIFDCDGTLLDTMGVWIELEDYLASLAGHVLTTAESEALHGYTLPETASFFHRELGLGSSATEVEAMVLERAVDFYATKAKARPGALAFVKELVRRGIRCSIVSSSPHAMLDPGLRATGFEDLFDIVVSTDDVGVSKRCPVPFEKARQAMGSKTDATWVFEDSTYAVKCAKAAGYRCVGVWDKDESGTFAELKENCDIAVTTWEDLNIEDLFEDGCLNPEENTYPIS